MNNYNMVGHFLLFFKTHHFEKVGRSDKAAAHSLSA